MAASPPFTRGRDAKRTPQLASCGIKLLAQISARSEIRMVAPEKEAHRLRHARLVGRDPRGDLVTMFRTERVGGGGIHNNSKIKL